MLIVDDFIRKAHQMATPDLEKLASSVRQILEKRKADPKSRASILLEEIKNLIPYSIVRQYNKLRKKMDAGELSEKEHEELVSITDLIENKSAERVKLLGELAQLKKISIEELIAQIDLKTLHAKA